jgi:hypothetical protein
VSFERITQRAKPRFRGEPEPYEDQQVQDHDTVDKWAQATGTDLEGEAQRACQKLMDVGRAQE